MTRKQYEDFARSEGAEVEYGLALFSTEAAAAAFREKAERRGFKTAVSNVTGGGRLTWVVSHTDPSD